MVIKTTAPQANSFGEALNGLARNCPLHGVPVLHVELGNLHDLLNTAHPLRLDPGNAHLEILQATGTE